MKKILSGLFLAATLLFATPNEVAAQNIHYATVDVYNGNGLNASDFIFSYDKFAICENNFKVKNNLGVATWFNFTITINGVWVYTGYVEIPAFGSVYFNDAFEHCNSSNGTIRISAW